MKQLTVEERYMLRCIEIAQNGLSTTAPNPMVGAVLVHQGRIIGEGFTSAFGGPHAEVNAIANIAKTELLEKSVLYVTLEPCSHFGKTPPCADLIIEKRIPKVVIGIADPNEKVSGRGIKRLRAAGIEVVVGMMEKECRKHHKRFLTFQERQRPYIILKWAETADGFLAPEASKRSGEPSPYWITSPLSRQLAHRWRSEEQAILVGTNTALQDNPKLDVRHWHGRSSRRILLDRALKVDEDFHLLDGTVPTMVLTEIRDFNRYREGIEYEFVDFSQSVPNQITKLLYRHQINSVLIEGGAKTLFSFLEADLWDEARVFKGPSRFEKGLKAPSINKVPAHTQSIGPDYLDIYYHD